jgi:hypothetical protein
MREYNYREIRERSCEDSLLKNTNKTMINNFNKVAKWIETNCPHLNGKFKTSHNMYGWVTLVVEDGKAYLECGSHGYGFDIALSATETATIVTGSCQTTPSAFLGKQFFKNDDLEKFLKEWKDIKRKVITENENQCNAYSDDFEA